jgi:hypothetical protein
MTNVESTAGSPGKTVSGIGGWLLLPLLGICLSPLLGAWSVWSIRETLGVLGQFPVHQGGFVAFETLVGVLLQIVAPIYLLNQMLRKRSTFPRLYQIWLGANVSWVVLDLVLTYLVFREVFASGQAELLDRETTQTLVRSTIGAAIWIPYMARSVRVRNTFVN